MLRTFAASTILLALAGPVGPAAWADTSLPISHITGKVTDQNGTPLAGVNVTVDKSQAPTIPVASTTTASDGTYEVTLDPGTIFTNEFDFHYTPPAGSGFTTPITYGFLSITSDWSLNVQFGGGLFVGGVQIYRESGVVYLLLEPINNATIVNTNGHLGTEFWQGPDPGVGNGTFVNSWGSSSTVSWIESYVPLPASMLTVGTHTFFARFHDDNGWSNIVSATVTTSIAVSEATGPDGQPVLTWSAVAGADHYIISSDDGLATTSATTFHDQNAEPGHQYYTVEAFDAQNNSLGFGAAEGIGGLPAAPTNLAIPTPTTAPTLTWDAVDGASSYRVYANGSFLATTTNTTYTDTNPTLGADTYTVTAVNQLGEGIPSNSVTVQIGTPPPDSVPPVVTGMSDRLANGQGWYNGPVTVTWASTDPPPSSGTPTTPPPTVLSQDGANQTATAGPSCDPAGNCATGSYGPVSIDTAAPTITYTIAPDPNPNNWHRVTVTVTFTCADGLSGIAFCTSPVTVPAEGAGQTVVGTAIDNAGNVTTVTTGPINIDKTPPAITGTASGTPNAAGWRKNPSTIRWTCTDALSGIHSCTATSVLGDGANQTVTGTAVDFAGWSTSATLSGINIDSTPPVITATVTPATNPNGWHRVPVTVTFTCTDALSGVAVCPGPITLSSDGFNQQVTSGKATDVAGNNATITVDGINIDKTLPTITGTASGTPNSAGWRNAPSTVTFTCADALSGIHTCTGPTTLGEGANQQVTGSAVDFAGNTRTATVSGVNIDLTPPTITYAVTPAANVNGWNNTGVTVTFTCADALSGVATCPASVTVPNDGADQTVTGTATDIAGNTATVTVTHIDIDQTAPTISGSVSGTPNGAGWYNTAPTVTFTCTDALSGIEACTSPVTLGDGAGQSVAGTAVDQAGNTSTTTVAGINVDTAAPTITYTVAPDPNANGWRNGPVTVTFTCTDTLSGVATCPDPVTLTGDGADQSVTGTVTDIAGNTTTVTADHINIDQAAPTITGSVSGTPNSAGWYNTAPTVTFTCTDTLSGIGACTSPVTLGDGAGQSVDGTAVDKAGNTSTATVAGINVDTAAPTITYTVTPAANANGWRNGPVTVTFTCADTLSGVASCPAPVTLTGDGADRSVTATATDVAGNTTTVTANHINIDTTAPTITASVSGTPNGAGWYNTTPTVTFTCTDALSGIDTCTPPSTLNDGAGQSVTGTARDKAANTSTRTVPGINVDTTPPVVTVTGVTSGGTYLQDTLPTAGCATTDATSGVATQATPTTSNDGNGHYTTTCTGATDVAGNTGPTVTVTFTAVPAVRAIGSGTRTSTGNSSVTAALTGTVAAGDTVAVSVATGTFAGAVGCADTQGNTYTVVVDRNTGNGRLFVCTAHLTQPLTTADTITATYPGFGGLSLVSADDISTLATTGTVDTTTSTSGNSPNPNSGTVTTAQAGELLFGVISHTSTPTITAGTGYTIVGQVIGGTGSGRRTLTPEYQLAGTPGGYAATGTLSAGQFWQAGIIAYQ